MNGTTTAWFDEKVRPWLDSRSSARLTWRETAPGVLRTTNDRFVIVYVQIPGHRGPEDAWLLRQRDEEGAAAWGPDYLGYSRGAHCRLDFALLDAEGLEWRRHNPTSVPEDYPALALSRFFWPISEGTTRGALAVELDGGRVVARLLGMHRADDDGVEPGAYTEMDVTDAVLRHTPLRTILRALLGRLTGRS